MWLSSGSQFTGAKDVLQFRLLQNAKGRVHQCNDDDILRKKATKVIENNYEKNDDVKTNQKKYAKRTFVDCDMEEEDSDDCNDDNVDVTENYDKRYARKYNDDDEEENEEKKRSFKKKKSSLYSPYIKLNGGVKQEKLVDSKNKRKFHKSSDNFY